MSRYKPDSFIQRDPFWSGEEGPPKNRDTLLQQLSQGFDLPRPDVICHGLGVFDIPQYFRGIVAFEVRSLIRSDK